MSLKWNLSLKCLWKAPPKNLTWCFLFKMGNFVCSFVPVFTILSHPVSLHVHSSSCQPFSFRMDLYLPPNCICLCSPLAFPVSWSHSNGICLCWACVDFQKVSSLQSLHLGLDLVERKKQPVLSPIPTSRAVYCPDCSWRGCSLIHNLFSRLDSNIPDQFFSYHPNSLRLDLLTWLGCT